MTTTQQRNPAEERRRDMRHSLDHLIGERVVHALGKPKDLLKVQVRPVGNDRHRVNIFVGQDVSSGRVANSFFLTTDDEGQILASSPEIVRVY